MKSPTVLMLSAAYPPRAGGVATHVANLVHGLAASGCRVHVVASREGTDKPGRHYRHNRISFWKLDQVNVPNFSGRRAPLGDVIARCLEEWETRRPDIIHAHDLDSVHIGGVLKANFKIPLVATVHRAATSWKVAKNVENEKDAFLEAMRIYKLADRLVVPSRASEEVLRAQGFSKRIISVVPHGLMLGHLASVCNHERVLRGLHIGNRQLILCPVRAEHHKDPLTFVRAAVALHNKDMRGRLLYLMTCSDSDPEYADVLALARAGGLRIGRDIIFRPFALNEMATLYRRSAACVIPSRRESFGQTVIEAFVYRTPVIAANAAALRELIVHSKTGLHFTDGDADDLARQIRRVLNQKRFAATLVENGLAQAHAAHDAPRMVRRYLALYRRQLQSRPL